MFPAVGSTVDLLLVTGHKVTGEVVLDERDFYALKSEDGKATVVVKNKIACLTTRGAKVEAKSEAKAAGKVAVLGCFRQGCRGVRFTKVSKGASKADFEAFMGSCPARSSKCKGKCWPDVSALPDEDLELFFDRLIVGDYPEV